MPLGLPVGFRSPVRHGSNASDMKENATIDTIPNWAFCRAILVDIGGLCNDRDLLCRSKNARCFQANIPPTCQCKLNHIPIYQENLKYHECFPIAHCNTTEYKACANSHGVCVDSNGDSQPDQCVCPPFLSKRRSNVQAGSDGQRIDGGEAISYDANWSSMNVILEKQVHSIRIACSTSTLLVCFYPPSSAPYQSLNQDLANGHAIAYFVGAGQSGQMMERTCVLTFSELRSRGPLSYRLSAAALDGHTTLFTSMEQHLCTYIDFSKHSAKRLPCGTTVHRNKVSYASIKRTISEILEALW
ncbi:unnamed protein product [Dibothriocephalus latus]|uniref:Uncharacterized protein n=1 Tax=Dibothriocephalus latus TaxID=60516 RepID=A0A3P6U7L8_DIBLA|nr:unnamed protein product [Dibothriocephalus latus]